MYALACVEQADLNQGLANPQHHQLSSLAPPSAQALFCQRGLTFETCPIWTAKA
jgi:hypothetical protein